MDFRSFMIQGVDGEFNFLPEGGLDDGQDSPSAKSVNNEIPVVDVEPISFVHPPTFAENIIDSGNASHKNDDLTPVGLSEPYDLEARNTSKATGKRKHIAGSYGEGSLQRTQEVPPRASKVAGDASSPLDVDSDLDIHEFPSANDLEQLYDIHDRAYMRQVVLDNVVNSRTRRLIYALHKARASCDVIREREIKKDKAYVELEKKCNEALQDLDKNPLIFDMHSEIETLQGQSLREKFKISEAQLLQENDSLKQDRAAVVTKVVPYAAMKLIQSDDMGILIVKLVKASMFHGRCAVFEEVANLKEPFVLEKMPGYRPSSKEEFD
ncbi:hypothetical protein Tco_1452565 [Tanacetum coccineum]